MRMWMPLAVLAAIVALGGCQSMRAAVVPPMGELFTYYRAPLMVDFYGQDFGGKEGTATIHNLALLSQPKDLTWDDTAIQDACAEGDITVIKGADYEFMHILGVYALLKVHVYGD